MTEGVAIRPCRLDECAAILALWGVADATPSITDHIEEIRRLVRENGDLFLVAECQGKLAGTIIAGWDGWRGNLYRLVVLPEYRRQGIGRSLVQEAERRLRAKGVRKISILVEHESALATSFWNSLINAGYQLDPRIIRYAKSL